MLNSEGEPDLSRCSALFHKYVGYQSCPFEAKGWLHGSPGDNCSKESLDEMRNQASTAATSAHFSPPEQHPKPGELPTLRNHAIPKTLAGYLPNSQTKVPTCGPKEEEKLFFQKIQSFHSRFVKGEVSEEQVESTIESIVDDIGANESCYQKKGRAVFAALSSSTIMGWALRKLGGGDGLRAQEASFVRKSLPECPTCARPYLKDHLKRLPYLYFDMLTLRLTHYYNMLQRFQISLTPQGNWKFGDQARISPWDMDPRLESGATLFTAVSIFFGRQVALALRHPNRKIIVALTDTHVVMPPEISDTRTTSNIWKKASLKPSIERKLRICDRELNEAISFLKKAARWSTASPYAGDSGERMHTIYMRDANRSYDIFLKYKRMLFLMGIPEEVKQALNEADSVYRNAEKEALDSFVEQVENIRLAAFAAPAIPLVMAAAPAVASPFVNAIGGIVVGSAAVKTLAGVAIDFIYQDDFSVHRSAGDNAVKYGVPALKVAPFVMSIPILINFVAAAGASTGIGTYYANALALNSAASVYFISSMGVGVWEGGERLLAMIEKLNQMAENSSVSESDLNEMRADIYKQGMSTGIDLFILGYTTGVTIKGGIEAFKSCRENPVPPSGEPPSSSGGIAKGPVEGPSGGSGGFSSGSGGPSGYSGSPSKPATQPAPANSGGGVATLSPPSRLPGPPSDGGTTAPLPPTSSVRGPVGSTPQPLPPGVKLIPQSTNPVASPSSTTAKGPVAPPASSLPFSPGNIATIPSSGGATSSTIQPIATGTSTPIIGIDPARAPPGALPVEWPDGPPAEVTEEDGWDIQKEKGKWVGRTKHRKRYVWDKDSKTWIEDKGLYSEDDDSSGFNIVDIGVWDFAGKRYVTALQFFVNSFANSEREPRNAAESIPDPMGSMGDLLTAIEKEEEESADPEVKAALKRKVEKLQILMAIVEALLKFATEGAREPKSSEEILRFAQQTAAALNEGFAEWAGLSHERDGKKIEAVYSTEGLVPPEGQELTGAELDAFRSEIEARKISSLTVQEGTNFVSVAIPKRIEVQPNGKEARPADPKNLVEAVFLVTGTWSMVEEFLHACQHLFNIGFVYDPTIGKLVRELHGGDLVTEKAHESLAKFSNNKENEKVSQNRGGDNRLAKVAAELGMSENFVEYLQENYYYDKWPRLANSSELLPFIASLLALKRSHTPSPAALVALWSNVQYGIRIVHLLRMFDLDPAMQQKATSGLTQGQLTALLNNWWTHHGKDLAATRTVRKVVVPVWFRHNKPLPERADIYSVPDITEILPGPDSQKLSSTVLLKYGLTQDFTEKSWWGQVETAAQIIEQSGKDPIIILGRDGETLYHIIRYLAQDDPSVMSRTYLVNISRDNVSDPNLSSYLQEKTGLSKERLAAGNRYWIIDPGGINGGLKRSLQNVLELNFTDRNLKTRFFIPNFYFPELPQPISASAVYYTTLEARNVHRNPKNIHPAEDHERIPKFNKKSTGFQQIDGHWEAICPVNVEENRQARIDALAYMHGLAFFLSKPMVAKRFNKVRELWRTILSGDPVHELRKLLDAHPTDPLVHAMVRDYLDVYKKYFGQEVLQGKKNMAPELFGFSTLSLEEPESIAGVRDPIYSLLMNPVEEIEKAIKAERWNDLIEMIPHARDLQTISTLSRALLHLPSTPEIELVKAALLKNAEKIRQLVPEEYRQLPIIDDIINVRPTAHGRFFQRGWSFFYRLFTSK